MRILLTSMEYPPYQVAGSGMFAWNLSQSLKGHEVTVITQYVDGAKEEQIIGNVKLIRIKPALFKSATSKEQGKKIIDQRILFGLSLRKYLNKIDLTQYDVLHNIDLISASFLNYKKINKQVPSINSINDYYALSSSWDPFNFPYYSSDFIKRYFHYNMVKIFNIKALSECSMIIANCKYVKKIVVKEADVKSKKVEVVYRGTDFKRFNIKPTKDKYTNKNILFIGVNMERKGLDYLIKAMPKIVKEFPESKLFVVGSIKEKYREKLAAFAIDHNCFNNIRFVDYVDKEKITKYYANANVVILPSIIEALGQVTLEGMASRTPVISTSVGGVPELITKETGFLIKSKDSEAIYRKIKYIFKHPKKAKVIGTTANKRVKALFTRERMMKDILECYKKAVNLKSHT